MSRRKGSTGPRATPALAEHLRRLRKEAEKTQRQLAEELGISQSYLSQMESGSAPFNLRYLRGFARSCHVMPGLLFHELGQMELEWLAPVALPFTVSSVDQVTDELGRATPQEKIELINYLAYLRFRSQMQGKEVDPGGAAKGSGR